MMDVAHDPTRISVMMGLGKNDSKKWNLFLTNGPYWNYLVSVLNRKAFFRSHPNLIEDAVQVAIAKIAKFMATGKFVYKEEGKGYFRSFLKVVVIRTAFDLAKKDGQYIAPNSRWATSLENQLDMDEMRRCNEKSNDMRRRIKLDDDDDDDDDLWKGIEKDSSRVTKQLDAYDDNTKLSASNGGGGRSSVMEGHLAGFEDVSIFDDDEQGVVPNAAAFRIWKETASKRELKEMQKLQIHILHQALGFVLLDEKVNSDYRRALYLWLIKKMSPGEIWQRVKSGMGTRNAWDVFFNRAKDVLRKKVVKMWRLVMPDGESANDAQVLMFWAELGALPKRYKTAKSLRNRAEKLAGKIK